MTKRKQPAQRISHQFIVFICTILLSLLGLLFVFEASVAESFSTFGNQYHYLIQHSIGLVIGVLAFIVGLITPPKLWLKVSPFLYIFGLLLLLLVFIPGIGQELNGASRWFAIGGLRFQPIEFVKFSVVAFFSQWLSQHQRFAPFLFLTGLPGLLIFLQPDLGSLLLLLAIAVSLYFIAGGNISKILALAAIGLPVIIVAIISSPYRMDRLTTFLNPESDPLGASFHIKQITLALGRGGLLGQGIGQSQQKFSYIPEASSDSIFAIIAEEVGFIGSSFIILLYCVFFYNAYKAILKKTTAKNLQLLGMGILVWIALQVILNLSAVVALIPLTGMPLPFISYGRSSLIMILFATGILIRIGKES